MFYSDTFPQIIQFLSLFKGTMLSGFVIGHPGQRRVPLLVICICVYIYIYVCVCVCVFGTYEPPETRYIYIYIYIYIQGVSGGIVNILEGGSMDCSE